MSRTARHAFVLVLSLAILLPMRIMPAGAPLALAAANEQRLMPAPPACVPVPAGLVSWWPGDGDAQDIWGTNSGTLKGGTTFVQGKVAQAFNFDGIAAGMTISDNESFELTSSLTIEGWLYVKGFSSPIGDILQRADNRAFLDPYYLSTYNDLRFHIEQDNYAATNLDVPIALNQWTHVAGTLDGATGDMRLYLNGAVASETFTSLRPFEDLDPAYNPAVGIGNHGSYEINNPYQGLVDELDLYSRALSATEVQSILNAGRSGKCKPPLLVASIGPFSQPSGAQYRVGSTVTIQDARGTTITGSTVNLQVTYPNGTSITVTPKTNSSGVVRYSFLTSMLGTYTFTVLNVSKPGWTYDSSLNVETQDTVTIP